VDGGLVQAWVREVRPIVKLMGEGLPWGTKYYRES